MSHFVILVVVSTEVYNRPHGHKEVKEKVTEILAPFNENIEVESHEVECWCCGRLAQDLVSKDADKTFGSYDKIRAEFYSLPAIQNLVDNRNHEQLQKLWDERIKDRQTFEREYCAVHPLAGRPDPNCSTCNGSGKEVTTRNPKAQWDWWRIGGRWDGYITENERSSENGFNFSKNHEKVKNNCRLIDDLPNPIPDKLIPFAIITPDGNWHERGNMGLWGTVRNEVDDWDDRARKILNELRGDQEFMVVACDLHI